MSYGTFPILAKWTKKLSEATKTKHAPDILRFVIDALDTSGTEIDKGTDEFEKLKTLIQIVAPEVGRAMVREVTQVGKRELMTRLVQLELAMREKENK